MKIGIDVNCLLFDRSGLGHYTHNLVKNLLLNDKKNEYFLYTDNFIQKRSERKKILLDLIKNTKTQKTKIKILPLPPKIKEFLLGTPFNLHYLIKEDLDIYFSPHFITVPKNGFKNTIVTIHDLIFLKYPNFWPKKLSSYYSKRIKTASKKAKIIIADSHSTKKDIIELLNVSEDKIRVIYPGCGEEFKKIKNNRKIIEKTNKYLNPKYQYILSVGTLEPRKNLPQIVKAFSLLPIVIQKKYKIAFVGSKGWKNETLNQTINDLNLKNKVIFTGFIPDEDLPYIYNRADIFVYPSLYEGFGLPPLEAMACGIPVITSNNYSLPEVVGRSAIKINPKDETELSDAMKKILKSPQIQDNLSIMGQKQAKKFTWKNTAKQLLRIFDEIIK